MQNTPSAALMYYELRGIHAWQYGDTWETDTSYDLEFVGVQTLITPRKLIKALYGWGYLPRYGKGLLKVVYKDGCYSVVNRSTGEPFFIFIPKECTVQLK